MTLTRQVHRRRDSASLADLLAPFNNKSPLLRRDVTPAACYDDCNNAYKIALSTGKVAALCASDSAFSKAYATCSSCIKRNEDDVSNIQDYVEPEFAQFIEYCAGLDALTTEVPVSTVIVTNTDGPQTSVVVVTTIETAETTIENAETSTTPCTICVPLTYTDGTGAVATVMVKPDLENLSRSQNSKSTKATIIGPVVAVVVLILILLGVLFLWRRHRSKKNANTPEDPPQEEPKYEKAQLHSDCISRGPTYELQGSVPPPPNTNASPPVAEMTVNEVAAQEMPASQHNALREEDQTGENRLR